MNKGDRVLLKSGLISMIIPLIMVPYVFWILFNNYGGILTTFFKKTTQFKCTIYDIVPNRLSAGVAFTINEHPGIFDAFEDNNTGLIEIIKPGDSLSIIAYPSFRGRHCVSQIEIPKNSKIIYSFDDFSYSRNGAIILTILMLTICIGTVLLFILLYRKVNHPKIQKSKEPEADN